MKREEFLTTVRKSLERGAANGPHRSSSFQSRGEPASSQRDRVDRLARELELVGGFVHRVLSQGEARETLLRILTERGVRRLVRGRTPLVEDLDLDGALRKAGVEVTVCALRTDVPAERLREAGFAADAGVTSADYGVAETGTLALLARPGQGRAVSLLPPLHVAVVRSSDVVSHLGELFERLTAEGQNLPSALTFITGPSRTADIELVLTVGVHGPKELHLIILDELA